MSEEKKSVSGLVPATIIVILAICSVVYGWQKSNDLVLTILAPFGVIAIGIVLWLIVRNILMRPQRA